MGEPRMEVEARLTCQTCKATPFILYRRQVIQKDGNVSPDVWSNVIWPANPNVMPPTNPREIVCPSCKGPLVRVAG